MTYQLQENALGEAMEAIAAGVSKPETRKAIENRFHTLDAAIIPVILHDALIECENQGVEREDIDGSWYGTVTRIRPACVVCNDKGCEFCPKVRS